MFQKTAKKYVLVIDSLREGYIHELRLNEIKSETGLTLLHNFGYYTLNNIPAGEKAKLTEAQMVHAHHAMAMPAVESKT